MIWTAILVAPGLVVAYLLFLRPRLAAYPAFKTFYQEADGFWAKVWALCGKSLTMAWSYLIGAIGALLNQLDTIAATLGDPNFKQQVSDLLHADPKYLGYFMMVVSAFTIASRLRSIAKG
ncbi:MULTISPECIES: hypothetical protein [unclassified Bradyrhizobium]|uniref:hypothetical protein n=1 Tax=unclassified Bradyrhizobium TaxID=2631580 RepID=UPI00247B0EFE|nr:MULTISPECIES: hypothetical protein [unclassified Bradyrhizobium]WGR74351.1 hypothetical protein MTX24_16635 [Bradyrhizobium sp. ISRA426]WGR79186.1 hypothetical protein MTX21_01750 [Bradyrhizobium sp. ISRA430]WGR90607.1 hypothetical protein MTX25_39560 [Bradyrhizobium sp. ISRA432]